MELTSEERFRMSEILKWFSRIMISVLTVVLACIVIMSTANLIWYLGNAVMKSANYLPDLNQTLHAFGLVLLVLIGIELLESIHTYISAGRIRIEAVLTLALIAIARKIIILEAADYAAPVLLGIGAVILALAVAYFLIHKVNRLVSK